MRAAILSIVLFFAPMAATAQAAATLVADSVSLGADETLQAEGNVVAYFDGATLRASAILYDGKADRMEIVGPIVLQTADGTILTATTATLDPRLQNGILQSARIVLDQQLQIVANQIDRDGAGLTQLYRSSASSCQVCDGRPPLWEIRAERVVHDATERQLYFTNATFLLRGLPLAYLPRIRLPDPTLARARGFLIPEQRNSSLLGFGIKVPYFIPIGRHRDLTLTPYLSPETRTLEFRYRQAFAKGDLTITGAVSDDTLASSLRNYVFAEGQFRLPNDYELHFDVETSSDRVYLQQYDFSNKDRLASQISLSRIEDWSYQFAEVTYFESLRNRESNRSLPPLIGEARILRSITPSFGGLLNYGASTDLVYRTSDVDGDDGRDLFRFGAQSDWQDRFVLENGLRMDSQMSLRGDLYATADDASYAPLTGRVHAAATAVVRYPLMRTQSSGTRHLLEPAVALGWGEVAGDLPANEDSTRGQLDRANLLSFSRYPGDDAVEVGGQLAMGLTWNRAGAEGINSTFVIGRILRDRPSTGFTHSSGLDGDRSDWLIAGQLDLPMGLFLDARTLWGPAADLTAADAQLTWRNDWLDLGATYLWQGADPSELRTATISEWTIDAAMQLNRNWRLSLDGRYDVAADRPATAGVGLNWQNECMVVDVSASRRYSSSTRLKPSTTFGLRASLSGFSAGRSNARRAMGCQN